MQGRLARPIGKLYDALPPEAYIAEGKATDEFLRAIDGDIKDIRAEVPKNEKDAQINAFTLFLRQMIRDDLQRDIEKNSGISKERMEQLIQNVMEEFSFQRITDIMQEQNLTHLTGRPLNHDWKTLLQVGAADSSVWRFERLFTQCYAKQEGLVESLCNAGIDNVLKDDLRESSRHYARRRDHAYVDICQYVEHATEEENPDYAADKTIHALGKVFYKIAAYHGLLYYDMNVPGYDYKSKIGDDKNRARAEAQLKEAREHGPYANALAIVNRFIDGMKNMPPAERMPDKLDAYFMKTLRDELSHADYLALNKNFADNVKHVCTWRQAKGIAVPKQQALGR